MSLTNPDTSANRHSSRLFAFPATCRLCSQETIRKAFSSPDSKIFAFPLMALLLFEQKEEQARYLFSVGKKKIRRAVDRNRIRRLMREALRLEVGMYGQPGPFKGTAAVVCIYTGSDMPDLRQIRRSVRNMIREYDQKYL